MNWQDDKEIGHSSNGGIGILAGDYVCTVKMQAHMITQFRYITKEEFDSFHNGRMISTSGRSFAYEVYHGRATICLVNLRRWARIYKCKFYC